MKIISYLLTSLLGIGFFFIGCSEAPLEPAPLHRLSIRFIPDSDSIEFSYDTTGLNAIMIAWSFGDSTTAEGNYKVIHEYHSGKYLVECKTFNDHALASRDTEVIYIAPPALSLDEMKTFSKINIRFIAHNIFDTLRGGWIAEQNAWGWDASSAEWNGNYFTASLHEEHTYRDTIMGGTTSSEIKKHVVISGIFDEGNRTLSNIHATSSNFSYYIGTQLYYTQYNNNSEIEGRELYLIDRSLSSLRFGAYGPQVQGLVINAKDTLYGFYSSPQYWHAGSYSHTLWHSALTPEFIVTFSR
jgi:hypothetical protein